MCVANINACRLIFNKSYGNPCEAIRVALAATTAELATEFNFGEFFCFVAFVGPHLGANSLSFS